MIYTLLIVLILILLALLIWLRVKYANVVRYARKSDAERIRLATELHELKEQTDYITFKLHGN